MSLQYMSFLAQNHFQREISEISTNWTIENLAETLSTILLDVPPPHLNRREDLGSNTSSEGEPEAKKNKKRLNKKLKKLKKPSKKSKKQRKQEEIPEGHSHHIRVQ